MSKLANCILYIVYCVLLIVYMFSHPNPLCTFTFPTRATRPAVSFVIEGNEINK